jgi:hypothetical protein
MSQRRIVRRIAPALAGLALATAGYVGLSADGSGASTTTRFDMVRSTGAVNAGCVPNASAKVRVIQRNENELMTVHASGLPANTEFDLFVIEIPDAPFGLAWYQSDLETNSHGEGIVNVQGRFNRETFSLSQAGPANGSNPLENVTGPAVNDTDVTFRPTHQYHLGLWFNSPQDAANAGCAGNTTPFNGEQNAGGQVLSTRNFPAAHGPLEGIG